MLFGTDIEAYVSKQLDADEQLVTVSWKKRDSSVRIKEAVQGCLALGVFIFVIVIINPDRSGSPNHWPLVDRLVAGTAIFAIGAIGFLIYLLFLYRTSDRRVTAITNKRIILLDFREQISKLNASDLNDSKLKKRRNISFLQLRTSMLHPQKDGSGLLVLDVYDDYVPKNRAARTWKQVQIEVSDVSAVSLVIPDRLASVAQQHLLDKKDK